MQTGHITRGLRPDWEPLVTLVGREVVGCFAWKFALEFDDGVGVHAYRNIATDRYLLLATDGRAFVYREEDRYEELTAAAALQAAFTGWEDARPRPRDPDAVRALLERHGVTVASETPVVAGMTVGSEPTVGSEAPATFEAPAASEMPVPSDSPA